MSFYVLLTIWLRQRGCLSPRGMSGSQNVDRDSRRTLKTGVPWPVKRDGLILKLYENSLSLACALPRVTSHAHCRGNRTYNEEQRDHNSAAVGVLEYAPISRFWSRAFGTWQSEFLATGSIVFLSITWATVARRCGSGWTWLTMTWSRASRRF